MVPGHDVEPAADQHCVGGRVGREQAARHRALLEPSRADLGRGLERQARGLDHRGEDALGQLDVGRDRIRLRAVGGRPAESILGIHDQEPRAGERPAKGHQHTGDQVVIGNGELRRAVLAERAAARLEDVGVRVDRMGLDELLGRASDSVGDPCLDGHRLFEGDDQLHVSGEISAAARIAWSEPGARRSRRVSGPFVPTLSSAVA
jgi:hypothetical protein